MARLHFLCVLSLSCIASIRGQENRGLSTISTANPAQGAGSYYALVIGIDSYRPPVPSLKTATADARAISDVLSKKYGFEVTLLLNENATRGAILRAIHTYRANLTSKDSLLIYYAGHGYLDKEAEKAYWLPVDAESSDSVNRISADDITTDVKVQTARHVLIISDSCYSGGLSREIMEFDAGTHQQQTYLAKMAAGKSRTLLASGGLEPVSDGGGAGGHSVFASALLHGLEAPPSDAFTGDELFTSSIVQAVAGRSDQLPQYSPIRNSSHESGDFVFLVNHKLLAAGGVHATVSASSHESRRVDEAALATGTKTLSSGKVEQAMRQFANREYDQAFGPLKEGCDQGNAMACRTVGKMLASGLGVGRSSDQALKAYETGCSLRDAESCRDGGSILRVRGLADPESGARAFDLFRTSCQLGLENGCVKLGELYEFGSFIQQDMTKSFGMFTHACDKNDVDGCVDLADSYSSGWGTPRDDVKALQLYQKACSTDPTKGCAQVAEHYEHGIGTPRDSQKAAALYQSLCDRKDEWATVETEKARLRSCTAASMLQSGFPLR